MQDRHLNRKKYFDEQVITTQKYVIPFVEETMTIDANTKVLEIGCGEGGNLKPFLDMGCQKVVGIDLSEGKINNAKAFFKDHPQSEKIDFIAEDIYNIENLGTFDLVFARDVLEHIHGQEKFMHFIKKFLKPDGKIFLGFPPWQNPFGGHQQMCRSALSKVPFLHLLPNVAYKGVMRLFKEKEGRINDLLEVKETRISIERFKRIVKQENYKVEKRCFYFINPNYEIKFGLKPREVWPVLAAIPYFRNFMITTNYYVLSAD